MNLSNLLDRVLAGEPGAAAELRAVAARDERAVVDSIAGLPAARGAAVARALGAPDEIAAAFESHTPSVCNDEAARRRRRLALLGATR
jgi:hypothetical protein